MTSNLSSRHSPLHLSLLFSMTRLPDWILWFIPWPHTAFNRKHPFSCWLNSSPPFTPRLSSRNGDSISTFAKIPNTGTPGGLAAIIKQAFFSQTVVILMIMSTEVRSAWGQKRWSESPWVYGPGVLEFCRWMKVGVRAGLPEFLGLAVSSFTKYWCYF